MCEGMFQHSPSAVAPARVRGRSWSPLAHTRLHRSAKERFDRTNAHNGSAGWCHLRCKAHRPHHPTHPTNLDRVRLSARRPPGAERSPCADRPLADVSLITSGTPRPSTVQDLQSLAEVPHCVCPSLAKQPRRPVLGNGAQHIRPPEVSSKDRGPA